MKRVLVMVLMSFIFGAAAQTCAVFMPSFLNVFFMPPVVLVFAVLYFKPLETVWVSLLCGFLGDVLGGFAIGSNMILMLLFAFSISAFNVFSGRVHRKELIYYVAIISFVYRLVLLMSNFIFLGAKTNIFIVHLLLGPIVDGLLSIIFYSFSVRVLSLIKAFDQSEFFKNRIGYGQ